MYSEHIDVFKAKSTVTQTLKMNIEQFQILLTKFCWKIFSKANKRRESEFRIFKKMTKTV